MAASLYARLYIRADSSVKCPLCMDCLSYSNYLYELQHLMANVDLLRQQHPDHSYWQSMYTSLLQKCTVYLHKQKSSSSN